MVLRRVVLAILGEVVPKTTARHIIGFRGQAVNHEARGVEVVVRYHPHKGIDPRIFWGQARHTNMVIVREGPVANAYVVLRVPCGLPNTRRGFFIAQFRDDRRNCGAKGTNGERLMHKAYVRCIERVIYLLEPVVVSTLHAVGNEGTFFLGQLFTWQCELGCFALAYVGKYEPLILLDRVAGD